MQKVPKEILVSLRKILLLPENISLLIFFYYRAGKHYIGIKFKHMHKKGNFVHQEDNL